MISFKALEVAGWRQFGSVHIDFHPRATIITGANGTGKTTLLNILSQHFGWTQYFIGTPRIDRRGAEKYFSGFVSEVGDGNFEVGQLNYDNGATATLWAPAEGASFQITISGSQIVPGVYVTSHRPVYSYQRITAVPTEVRAGYQLFEQYLDDIRQYYLPNARIRSPSYRLKAALISLAMFGYGNKIIAPNPDARDAFDGFSEVLMRVLPPSFEFREISIQMPEVVLRTGSGDFSLDAASGGIAALLDVSWQIYMRSRTCESFTVVMDEPENHLHPSLQRAVLPGLISAFPQAQFIVATHNPFVVTSVRDSNVVALDFVDGHVKATALADIDRSATANQVLTSVLGVPFPVPLWVEGEVEKIADSIRDEELTAELLARLRTRLNAIGLGDLFPDVIDRLLPADDAGEGNGA